MTVTEDLEPQIATDSRRGWFRRVLGFSVIFLCGGITGAAVTYHLQRRADRHEGRPDPEWIARKIARRYDLSDKETKRVLAVVQRHFERVDEIRNKAGPDFAEALNTYEGEMADVLGPDLEDRWRQDFQRIRKKLLRRTKKKESKQ